MSDTHKIKIREAGKKDSAEIVKMLAALCEYEGLRKSTFTDSDFLRDGHGLSRAFNTIIAEMDGVVAGFMTYYAGYDMPSATRGFHLGDFFVKPEFRRNGIGKSLFCRLAEITLKKKYSWVSWTVLDKNSPAIALYNKMGAVTPDGVTFMAIGRNGLERAFIESQEP